MKDLHVIFGDFATTSVTIEAVSKRGKSLFAKHFGAGAVAVTLPKSKAPDFTEYAAGLGLEWQTFTPSAYALLYPSKGIAPAGAINTRKSLPPHQEWGEREAN